MNFVRSLLYTCLTLCLTGCCPYEILDVHNDFLMPDRLASAHASTPDPRLECPLVGQRLRINWYMDQFAFYKDVTLCINVRFINHSEDSLKLNVLKPRGMFCYFVVNDDYCDTGGIVSYKIQLIGDGSIIDEWIHPLWQDLITVGEKESDDRSEKKDLKVDGEYKAENVEKVEQADDEEVKKEDQKGEEEDQKEEDKLNSFWRSVLSNDN
jgi:hypothetical protein